MKEKVGAAMHKNKMNLYIIMTVETMFINCSLSKRLLTSKAAYSKPWVHLPSFFEKNREAELFTLLLPHSKISCRIKLKF